MKIDEAIVHERDIAAIQRNNDKLNKTLGANSPYYKTDCLECAEEHEQLAEWLEELKAYKRNTDICPMCDTYCSYLADEFEEGYRKAIDDFVNACKEDILCQTFGLHINGIERIAEQLKAGGENENYNKEES